MIAPGRAQLRDELNAAPFLTLAPNLMVCADSGHVFSARSWRELEGVNPKLVTLASDTLQSCPVDFAVTDGLRSASEQQDYFDRGLSKTLNSRHLTGDAIDVVAYINGQVSWEAEHYHVIAHHMKQAAKRWRVDLEWGGEAFGKSFFDGPHFQIAWEA